MCYLVSVGKLKKLACPTVGMKYRGTKKTNPAKNSYNYRSLIFRKIYHVHSVLILETTSTGSRVGNIRLVPAFKCRPNYAWRVTWGKTGVKMKVILHFLSRSKTLLPPLKSTQLKYRDLNSTLSWYKHYWNLIVRIWIVVIRQLLQENMIINYLINPFCTVPTKGTNWMCCWRAHPCASQQNMSRDQQNGRRIEISR